MPKQLKAEVEPTKAFKVSTCDSSDPAGRAASEQEVLDGDRLFADWMSIKVISSSEIISDDWLD